MSHYPSVVMKTDKVATVAFRHPWIFSGALTKRPDDVPHGSLVRVCDPQGRVVGTGTYSAYGTIAVRVLEFGDAVIDRDWFKQRLSQAHQRRVLLGYCNGSKTTGYRLVFGEADCIPGLVVDRYAESLVMQISTAGLETFRDDIVDALVELFQPRAVIERSDITSRKDEHLSEITALRYGDDPGAIEFLEHGMKFISCPLDGQKTGFYLDQKDLRKEIRCLGSGKTVLNLFSYSGAAGVAAMLGGAKSVHNIDASDPALSLCATQARLNELDCSSLSTQSADVFKWLGANPTERYDLVIMDPPALIKSQRDAESGRKAYHFINRAALRLVKPGGLFITSSCSAFFNEDDFMHTLRRASVQDSVHLDVLKIVRQSPDHPISIYFPESAYLKTFVCLVR